MSLHLVTGYKGTPHITSADQGVFNAGCVGSADYVFKVGRMFEAQVVTNNAVRIFDGSLSMQGRHVNLESGTFLDVTISNGSQAMNRNDLIVMRYNKDRGTGVESVELAVIQGALYEGTAVDPTYTKGDILAGETVHEMPLYRVRMSGLNIASVEPIFKLVTPLADAQRGRNLLINGDFLCNQRRLNSYNSNGTVQYSVDMWRIHNIKLDVLTEGVKITGTSSTATGYFTQFVKVDELAEVYTISAMVDGKIRTFTTALSSEAAEKVFDNFKITALYVADSKHIKVNICPSGTKSVTIKYIDLFEGGSVHQHIKEELGTALMRCRAYIQGGYKQFPIVYSYPGTDTSKRSYTFYVPYDPFVSTPLIYWVNWSYMDNAGNTIGGGKNDSLICTVLDMTKEVLVRTSNGSPKHSDCHGVNVDYVLTCEHAPNGDA